jgi:hypothetical protein
MKIISIYVYPLSTIFVSNLDFDFYLTDIES